MSFKFIPCQHWIVCQITLNGNCCQQYFPTISIIISFVKMKFKRINNYFCTYLENCHNSFLCCYAENMMLITLEMFDNDVMWWCRLSSVFGMCRTTVRVSEARLSEYATSSTPLHSLCNMSSSFTNISQDHRRIWPLSSVILLFYSDLELSSCILFVTWKIQIIWFL